MKHSKITPDQPDDARDFSNLESIETKTGRTVIYNSKDATERISSSVTLPNTP